MTTPTTTVNGWDTLTSDEVLRLYEPNGSLTSYEPNGIVDHDDDDDVCPHCWTVIEQKKIWNAYDNKEHGKTYFCSVTCLKQHHLNHTTRSTITGFHSYDLEDEDDDILHGW